MRRSLWIPALATFVLLLVPAAESCKGAPFTYNDDGKLVTLKTGDVTVTRACSATPR